MKIQASLFVIIAVCTLSAVVALKWLSNWNATEIQATIQQYGLWAPIVYVVLYIVATVLVLPSTVLNLTGGAVFGAWMGIVWTSIGAILAAIASFAFTRTVGRTAIERRLKGRWREMDDEIRQGGLFYLFAIRLVPVMPYGLVNFAAGLTSVTFKDYLIGTVLGTVPSVLPFVLLGSSGVRAANTGDLLPLLAALGLTGLLVAGSTWYRQRMIKR